MDATTTKTSPDTWELKVDGEVVGIITRRIHTRRSRLARHGMVSRVVFTATDLYGRYIYSARTLSCAKRIAANRI